MGIVTIVAPVNIAVIKYWGKKNENLILPLNDSVSLTLCTEVMCAKTSVCANSQFDRDRMWLNGKEENVENARLRSCLKALKERAAEEGSIDAEMLSWHVHICSENNFPTAAGLASSAAGYACLVSAIAKLYRIQSDISGIARLGSGSACRSIYGGFVQWHSGKLEDGSDSIATQVADSEHWPEMRVLVLVVSDNKKKTSSTKGMRDAVITSELLKHRVAQVVPQRMKVMLRAIKNKDFPVFAEITMKDSNQFHAVALDTYPPCFYMNDVSHSIVEMVHAYNNYHQETKVAYTFDAGPNGCLYLLESEVPKVLSVVKNIFPPGENVESGYVKGLVLPEGDDNVDIDLGIPSHGRGLVKYVIYTKGGEGPTEVKDGTHLLDRNGNPLEK